WYPICQALLAAGRSSVTIFWQDPSVKALLSSMVRGATGPWERSPGVLPPTTTSTAADWPTTLATSLTQLTLAVALAPKLPLQPPAPHPLHPPSSWRSQQASGT
ncbi:hypothetical protein OTU49_005972, partial [Cherax quadricarinatus]